MRAAARNPAAWDALAARAGMSSLRRQLLPWAAEHMPDQVERLFSVSEVFWIGTDEGALDHTTLDAWGMSFEPIDGCHCLRLPRAGSWDSFVGREPTKQFGSGMVDLNLKTGTQSGQGHCVITAANGDQVFASWNCTGTHTVGCAGRFTFRISRISSTALGP